MINNSKLVQARNVGAMVVDNKLAGTFSPLKHFFCRDGVDASTSGTVDNFITDAITQQTVVSAASSTYSGYISGEDVLFEADYVEEKTNGYVHDAIPATSDILIIIAGGQSDELPILRLGIGNNDSTGWASSSSMESGAGACDIYDSSGTQFAYGGLTLGANDENVVIMPVDRSSAIGVPVLYANSATPSTGTLKDMTASIDIPLSTPKFAVIGRQYASAMFVFPNNGLPSTWKLDSLWMAEQWKNGNYVFPPAWANL